MYAHKNMHIVTQIHVYAYNVIASFKIFWGVVQVLYFQGSHMHSTFHVEVFIYSLYFNSLKYRFY